MVRLAYLYGRGERAGDMSSGRALDAKARPETPSVSAESGDVGSRLEVAGRMSKPYGKLSLEPGVVSF